MFARPLGSFAFATGLVAAVAVTTLLAKAASVQTPSTAVTLVLDLPAGTALEPERLRAAIGNELGVPIVWERDAAGGTLVVRQEGVRVVVAFDRRDGRHDGRSIALDADSATAERDVVLLAGNVARDQTAQFDLPPAPTPPPPSASAPVAIAPPVAAAPAHEEVAAPHFPPSAPRSPCEARGRYWPFAVDLVPGVGFSSIDGGRAARRASIGALGALSGRVRGASVSGVVDVDRGAMCGLQLAGIASVAADASGAQIAGITNVARGFSGAQIAGVANVATLESRGAQIGAINVSGGDLAGVQIGVVNYAPHADFQFGVVNVVGDGRLRFDAWTKPEMGLAMASVKHGGAHYHWTYAFGTRVVDAAHPWAALGLGAHLIPSDKLYVDVDLSAYVQLLFAANRTARLTEARAVVGYSVLPGVALFGGPAINLAAVDSASRSGAPDYAQTLGGTSAPRWLLWPGLVLGVEVL